jgi:hypothetical protein
MNDYPLRAKVAMVFFFVFWGISVLASVVSSATDEPSAMYFVVFSAFFAGWAFGEWRLFKKLERH